MAKRRKAWWVYPPSIHPAIRHDRSAAMAAKVAEYREKLLTGAYEVLRGPRRLHIWRKRRSTLPLCGAKTRAGGECRMRVVAGKRRCRLHGGLSTGPRSEEGRARIAESNRRRWTPLNGTAR